jgi:multidrug transporter EmrE-like cation transporter
MSYVYSLFLGYAVFHEEITGYKTTGVAVIIAGIVLLGRGNTA